MDLHYKQEVTVGGVVIVGLIAFVLGTMWLGGKTFRHLPLLRARFENVGKLAVGSAVKISGVKVGRVERIEFVDVGDVEVWFSLPSKVVPKEDATATIVESVAFNDAFLQFKPGTSSQLLAKDAVIPGRQETGLFDRASSLGDRADSVMLGAQQVLNKRTGEDLHNTLVAIQKTLKIVQDKLPASSDEAQSALASLRRLSDRLDSTLANPAIKSSITRLDTVTRNLSSMSAQFTTTGAHLDSLLTSINAGKGTFGKLATDSGLYVDARAASQSLKAFLDELQKHPGKITVQVKIF